MSLPDVFYFYTKITLQKNLCHQKQTMGHDTLLCNDFYDFLWSFLYGLWCEDCT